MWRAAMRDWRWTLNASAFRQSCALIGHGPVGEPLSEDEEDAGVSTSSQLWAADPRLPSLALLMTWANSATRLGGICIYMHSAHRNKERARSKQQAGSSRGKKWSREGEKKIIVDAQKKRTHCDGGNAHDVELAPPTRVEGVNGRPLQLYE